MELKSCTYATVTTLGDFGPWISKVVLDLPCTVRANDIDARTFHIYVERHERTGEILMRKERGADHAAPSVGYVDVLAAYPCDECGRKLAFGTHVALEIAEQLNWEMPDYLAISVGDGCTIAGVWKGFKDLYAIGFIDKLPRLISAQSYGCYPINRAIQENKPWEPMEENTIADSISVGVPRNADKALMAIRESNGIAVNVSDEEILAEFVGARLPEPLYDQLRAYIRTVRAPLAVRSSSKLEDSHYQPFAGIYSTYMIPHTDNEDQMLRLLVKAIKCVYASVYYAASRAYIQTSQNLISEEKMAVIIQEVCGTEQDGLYFPTCSGVARSINYYPIGDERPEDGVCNVAMGLGKLVVDGGRTLRFSPRYPQKVLQTSTPELALRDTQNEVLALSLSPEEFRTSIDDAVNLHRLNVREIDGMRNARFVCSVWDRENERISDSPFDQGRKVITFNNILKYNTFPLAEIISDILTMGAEEMRCPVEVEFAVNMDVAPGQRQVFNLLQIRPIIDNQDNRPIDWSSETPDHALIYGEQALGIGRMNDISDIVYVKTPMFDSLATEKIADELLALNARMRDEQRTYILVGPGRWGSSDPFLGVPVKWTHISEAKVIVECGIERFDVEPSQGTHFFQNVTSLGVGYLTINPFRGDGLFREKELDARQALYDGTYLRQVRFDSPLWVCIDGRSNKGMVREGKND